MADNAQHWLTHLPRLNGSPLAPGLVHEVAALSAEHAAEIERSRRYRAALYSAVELMDRAESMSMDHWTAIREHLLELLNAADSADLSPPLQLHSPGMDQ
jgi:hypothetical protein